MMASRSRSASRGRSRTRSPRSEDDLSRSPSPPARRRRYESSLTPPPRSRSRTRSWSPVPRRNGRYRSRTRSPSRGYSRSPSRSIRGKSLSKERSATPLKSTKIVVERLTKNINDDHLREIFGQFGPIQDLDLPINRQFGTNRGTAYILYTHEADAEAAIAHMHESMLDGALINVSIVLPRRKMSPAPPTARRGANINPLNPPPVRGPPNGPAGFGPKGGGAMPIGVGPMVGRGRPSPRFGPPRSDVWRPGSVTPPGAAPPSRGTGGSRYRDRSRSPSYSRSPHRRGGGGRRYSGDYDARRRSPSYDNYRDRSRSDRGYR